MRTQFLAALCRRTSFALALLLALTSASHFAVAGVVNPDVSVIGQPRLSFSDEPSLPGRDRLQLEVGETEILFDAALNPYARGTVVTSLAAEGIELEEGYFVLHSGLPAGLALKGGKYRVGFGRLNPSHPHTYPFANRFHVLAEYLPGDEALNDTGLSLSRLFAGPGDLALEASADWLAGSSFRDTDESEQGYELDPKRDEPRPAALGRVSAFKLVGERSGIDVGLSAVTGTNNVAASARTILFGLDAKAKLWRSPQSYLLLQAEGLHLSRDAATLNGTDYTLDQRRATGGYLFADYNFGLRYNLGASFERFKRASTEDDASAIGLFAGYALMEETTAFRVDWNRFSPGQGPAVQSFSLRVLYSMGPHKAHQF